MPFLVATVSWTQDGAATIEYNLTGVDPACTAAGDAANSCGIHIHAGTSCATPAEVQGHYYGAPVDSDPWVDVVYTADAQGAAKGSVDVTYGYGKAGTVGHAFVLHDKTGARISCTVIKAGGAPSDKGSVVTSYSLEANTLKFDYVIKDFPYKQNNTKLAIDSRFKTKAKVRQYIGQSREKVDSADPEEAMSGAQFSWEPTVLTGDGEDVDVLSSEIMDVPANSAVGKKEKHREHPGEVNQRIIWTFNKEGKVSEYVWDPTLEGGTQYGFASGATFSASAAAKATTTLVALTALVAVWL